MSPREWSHRLEDTLDAIARIIEYTRGMSFKEFADDNRTVDAVLRNFIVIGEASRGIPNEIRTRYPAVPWRLMGDMRNFAVHEYWGVDLRTIWATALNDLPPLAKNLRMIQESNQEGTTQGEPE